MNTEMLSIAEQMKDAWEGDPWFGRNMRSLLDEVEPGLALQKPDGQHSILELVWHMVNWKEFAISRLRHDKSKPVSGFDARDWVSLDHSDTELWFEGRQRLSATHNELVELVQAGKDEILSQKVWERTYHFKKLLHGVLQHDIYHLGQIAYLVKLLRK